MGVFYVPHISCKIFINDTKISGGIMISFVDEILYDYLDKVITKKQVYEYLSSYGYSKKQIKDFIKEVKGE